MKHVSLFLLFAFFFSSCAPAATLTSTSTPTQTITPLPTATQTPSPTPTLIPTPTPIGGGSGKVIFTLDKATFEKIFPDLNGDVNIFTSNIDGTELTPITNGLKGAYYIEGVSPDGEEVLVSSYSSPNASNGSLYIINVGSGNMTPFKLASGLFEQYGTGPVAKWIDNERIVFLDNGKDGSGIYVINIDGTNLKKIGAPSGKYLGIVSTDETRVYWSSSVKENFKDDTGFLYSYGDFNALSWTNLDGSGDGPLESSGKPIITSSQQEEYAFSPDGKSIAWIPAEFAPSCHYWFFLAGLLRDGTYTKDATKKVGNDTFSGTNPSNYGKVIDTAFVKDYASRCFIMYVASLSQMDNPIKVVLMPPDNFFDLEFTFGKDYDLKWLPDGTKLALFYRGASGAIYGDYHDAPVLFYIKPTDADPKLTPLYSFPVDSADKIWMLDFTPDGQQIRLFDNTDNQRERFFDLQKLDYVDDSGNNENIYFEKIYNLYWLP